MKPHKIVLCVVIAALLVVAHGCAFLNVVKRESVRGGIPAGVALILTPVGPVYVAIGTFAAVVGVSALTENQELRDGDLIGKKAAKEYVYVDREVEKWSVPWGKIALYAGLFLLWLKGHHIVAWLRGGGVGRLLNIFLPSWAQKANP